MGVELTGKTLGVVGCGNIGSIVASRALSGDARPLRPVPVGGAGDGSDVEKVDLEALLRAPTSSRCTPLTEKTRNILDANAIARCKDGVRIVNCARGGLIDEAALLAALPARWPARPSTSSPRPATDNPLFRAPTSSARRIWGPRRPRRRRTSPCRSPSRWPTT